MSEHLPEGARGLVCIGALVFRWPLGPLLQTEGRRTDAMLHVAAVAPAGRQVLINKPNLCPLPT